VIETVSARIGTVALYVDMVRESARRAAADVAGAMRGAGFEVALCEDQNRELNLGTSGASVENAVVLVTVGGDGTLLRAAQIAAPLRLPLFGINTGRLGFLTEMDGRTEDLTKLPDILRAGLPIDERSALSTELRGIERMALNDVVVRRTGDSHMTPFSIFVDGKEAARVPADGVAVATPTGSTAYFLSGGGPILAPDVAAFGIIALLPHTLFSRPLVVRDDSRIELVSSADVESVALDCDGRTVDRLAPGERVVVTRYPFPVRFARRAPLDFFTLLEDKLRWNAPIKDR
jgi:NAD+ kinase